MLVDWLPWNHTVGGNHNFGLVLYNGGTLYIDEGKPVPGLIEKTVRNLREVAPTIYFNVPRGYEALLPLPARGRGAAQDVLQPARPAVLRRGRAAAAGLAGLRGARACRPAASASSGSPATARPRRRPFAMCTNRGAARAGTVGLPVDGLEMKLAPVADKLEARFRGPNITPGYWRQPELTRAAFDEEGYYRTGDALRFVDPADPQQGFEFDGRIAEDFKLVTGTWVSVGPLRARIIAAGAPLRAGRRDHRPRPRRGWARWCSRTAAALPRPARPMRCRAYPAAAYSSGSRAKRPAARRASRAR